MSEGTPRASRWRGIVLTALGLVLPLQGGCACGCGAGLARGGKERGGTRPVCRVIAGPSPGNDEAFGSEGIEPVRAEVAAG